MDRKTLPWGTPDDTYAQAGLLEFITVLCFLILRNAFTQSSNLPLIPLAPSLTNKRTWGTDSKALAKS